MSKHSEPSPGDPDSGLDFDALVQSILALDTLDRLKLWQASYTRPHWWIGYSIALDNGDPHPRFRCCAQFNLN